MLIQKDIKDRPFNPIESFLAGQILDKARVDRSKSVEILTLDAPLLSMVTFKRYYLELIWYFDQKVRKQDGDIMERKLCVMREWKMLEQKKLHWILVELGKRKLSKLSHVTTFAKSVSVNLEAMEKVKIQNRIWSIKSRKRIKLHQMMVFQLRNP